MPSISLDGFHHSAQFDHDQSHDCEIQLTRHDTRLLFDPIDYHQSYLHSNCNRGPNLKQAKSVSKSSN